jgi:cobaltochelatase CobT
MRAISGDGELEVSFAKPTGRHCRPFRPAARTAAQADPRGSGRGPRPGDSMALRSACHDMRCIAASRRTGRQARAVFDAVEQARCRGDRRARMVGRGRQSRRHAGGQVRPRQPRRRREQGRRAARGGRGADGAREADRAGAARSGERLVELWRDWIEERAGPTSDGLLDKLDDQHAFARAVRDMLVSMEMAEELGEDEEERRAGRRRGSAPRGRARAARTAASRTAAPPRPRPRKWRPPARTRRPARPKPPSQRRRDGR